MELLVNSVEKFFADNPQPYLVKLYKALICMTYYGLFRIGEVTHSEHAIKAKNVQIGRNKNKIMFILFSSKTHNQGMRPQTVKISEICAAKQNFKANVCPFAILAEYMSARPTLRHDSEEFFVFWDRSPVQPEHFQKILSSLIKFNHMDPTRYRVHDLRSGHATEMLEQGIQIDIIKKLGRWKSSAVFKYLKT